MNVVSTALAAIVAFASTNVDDLLLLAAFFTDRKIGPAWIVVGQMAGIGALIAISLVAARAAIAISPAYVGFLGFAPLAIGLQALFARDSEDEDAEGHSGSHGLAGSLAVATATIGDGGDNIGVYTPLFATQSAAQTILTVAIFAVLTAGWCFVAWLVVTRPRLAAPIRRHGETVLPFVLIGLGVWILVSSGAAALLLGFASRLFAA